MKENCFRFEILQFDNLFKNTLFSFTCKMAAKEMGKYMHFLTFSFQKEISDGKK